MRRNEILSLSQRSIDWTNRVASLIETKIGDPRHVYLNEAACHAIGSLPARDDDDRIFPFQPHQTPWLSTVLRNALAWKTSVSMTSVIVPSAGLCRMRHKRHSAATLLLAQGVHPRAIMELLGHSSITVTMNTYGHVLPAMMRDAADKMDAILGS